MMMPHGIASLRCGPRCARTLRNGEDGCRKRALSTIVCPKIFGTSCLPTKQLGINGKSAALFCSGPLPARNTPQDESAGKRLLACATLSVRHTSHRLRTVIHAQQGGRAAGAVAADGWASALGRPEPSERKPLRRQSQVHIEGPKICETLLAIRARTARQLSYTKSPQRPERLGLDAQADALQGSSLT